MSICDNCIHWKVCVSPSMSKKDCQYFEKTHEELPHIQPLQYLPVEFIINKFIEYEKRLEELEKKVKGNE